MKKEELRVIPVRNYVILGILLLLTILVVYYFYMWTIVYQKTKFNEPILDEYMQVINYNELGEYLVENPNAIIYVSVLGDEEIWKFERRFEKTLKNKELGVEMLYLNITDDIKDEAKKLVMQSKYRANFTDITEVPSVMIYSMGELKYVYSIKENGYNIRSFKNFLNSVLSNIEDEMNG